jgi:hypothetical protein
VIYVITCYGLLDNVITPSFFKAERIYIYSAIAYISRCYSAEWLKYVLFLEENWVQPGCKTHPVHTRRADATRGLPRHLTDRVLMSGEGLAGSFL